MPPTPCYAVAAHKACVTIGGGSLWRARCRRPPCHAFAREVRSPIARGSPHSEGHFLDGRLLDVGALDHGVVVVLLLLLR
mmetsp:Transcript_9354/g.29818  ORF Transcript_9354/g.29818 Transcript_9354/m.29818 type:complete len:80 (-) Transcript_9354:4-243(-)